jgi:hypothetical protein
MLVQPWRGDFRFGWHFARKWQRTWLVIGLLAAHQVWWQVRHDPLTTEWPGNFSPALTGELAKPAAVKAGDSTAACLFLVIPPEPFSALLALAILTNFAGLGGAFRNGCKVAFPKRGTLVFWLVISSAAAHLAASLLEWSGLVTMSSFAGKVLSHSGAWWIGATAAFALAWIVRFMETEFRAPDEMLQIQWAGSASGRVARLWPVAVAVAAWKCVASIRPPSEGSVELWAWRGAWWALSLLGAFLPLILLHWRGAWGWRGAFHEARIRLMRMLGPLLCWVVLAWGHFFLVHLAVDGIASGISGGSVWLLAWKSAGAYIHSAVAVWLLASWVAMQAKAFAVPIPPAASPPAAGR